MKDDPEKDIINLRDKASIQARRPVLVAHRGGVIAPNAPENSLAAIQLAAVHGYDMVELDVREPKDGEPVLFHGLGGRGLLADCGVPRFLQELTSDELTAICYRASTEHIATLDQALAACASLKLGVMLDIKAGGSSERFLERIADLLRLYQLASSTVTISHDPAVREALAGQVILPVSREDVEGIRQGQALDLHGQFWFGWGAELDKKTVLLLQQNGAFIIVSINTFHYPAHARHALARQDVKRLLVAGVEGFQIDSVYETFFQ